MRRLGFRHWPVDWQSEGASGCRCEVLSVSGGLDVPEVKGSVARQMTSKLENDHLKIGLGTSRFEGADTLVSGHSTWKPLTSFLD